MLIDFHTIIKYFTLIYILKKKLKMRRNTNKKILNEKKLMKGKIIYIFKYCVNVVLIKKISSVNIATLLVV